MAAPSRETLLKLGSDTGHQPATLEKVLRLLDLLQEIANDEFLSPRLALKGGTALNVFYLDLDRLSVDIDLNYVGSLDREVMLKERADVEAALDRIWAAGAYSLTRQPDEHAGGKWIARHDSALGGKGSLEIDVNYMMREPLFDAQRMASKTLGGNAATNVLVLDIHEIIAGKMVALLARHAARDLFDARRILGMKDLDWTKIRTAMIGIGATARDDFRQISVDNITGDENDLKKKLAMCLPTDTFADAKSASGWIKETVDICKAGVAPLIDFSDGEKAFLDGVIERGEIDTSGLSGDAELLARVSRMPMLKWKAQNVKVHIGKAKP